MNVSVHHAFRDPQDEVVVNSLGSLNGADNCDSGLARCVCVGHTSSNKSAYVILGSRYRSLHTHASMAV
jgi:hypothetical protein